MMDSDSLNISGGTDLELVWRPSFLAALFSALREILSLVSTMRVRLCERHCCQVKKSRWDMNCCSMIGPQSIIMKRGDGEGRKSFHKAGKHRNSQLRETQQASFENVRHQVSRPVPHVCLGDSPPELEFLEEEIAIAMKVEER